MKKISTIFSHTNVFLTIISICSLMPAFICEQKISGTIDFSKMTTKLNEILPYANNKLSFIVMTKDGTILTKQHLSSEGVTAYTDDSTLHVASAAKWLATATIMSLVDDGTLSLTTTAGSVYPSDAPTEVTSLTLLQMLTHTSGYAEADDWVFDASLTLAAAATGIFKGGSVYTSSTDETTTASKSTTYFTPGTQVAYSDIGLQLAGAIAVLKSGKDFNTLFQERIASKLGMTNAAFTAFDGFTGTNYALGDGLTIRMIDYANFLKMLLNNGTYNGAQILSTTSVESMLKDHTGTLPVNAMMQSVISFDMITVSFGIGSWIYEFNDLGNGTVFTSPGIKHGFQNHIDTATGYLMVLFLKASPLYADDIHVFSEEIRPIVRDLVLHGKKIGETSSHILQSIQILTFIACILTIL